MSVTLFANIFSYSIGVFSFFDGFLCCAKAFKFDEVPFIYFCFYSFGRLAYLTLIFATEKLDILPFLEMRNWVSGLGNGNLFQCSCLENSMDRGTWWATVHGVTKSWILLSIDECNWVSGKSQLVSQDINLGSLALIVLFLSTVLYHTVTSRGTSHVC